jgi:hypothetical protein
MKTNINLDKEELWCQYSNLPSIMSYNDIENTK